MNRSRNNLLYNFMKENENTAIVVNKYVYESFMFLNKLSYALKLNGNYISTLEYINELSIIDGKFENGAKDKIVDFSQYVEFVLLKKEILNNLKDKLTEFDYINKTQLNFFSVKFIEENLKLLDEFDQNLFTYFEALSLFITNFLSIDKFVICEKHIYKDKYDQLILTYLPIGPEVCVSQGLDSQNKLVVYFKDSIISEKEFAIASKLLESLIEYSKKISNAETPIRKRSFI